jgi:hypothetical protein
VATDLADRIASTAIETARAAGATATRAATEVVPARIRRATPDAAAVGTQRRQAARPQSNRAAPERARPAAAPFWASRRQDAQTGPALQPVLGAGVSAERILRRPGAPTTHERPTRRADSAGATHGPGAPSPFVPKPVSAVGGSSAGSASAAGSFLIAGLMALLAYALFPPELGGRLRPTSDRRRLRPRSSRLERPG